MNIDLLPGEIIVDSFAGGGGASVGIEMALGRSPDDALNHNPEALAIHRANHPHTRHHCQDIWQAQPRDVAAGRSVGLAWFSPDCRHHSKAKGSKPVDKNVRDLAWVVCWWAHAVAPRIIILENVEEFQDWSPLDKDDRPIKSRKGETFKRWVNRLKELGYRVEWRELKACEYGAPTSRNRLYVVARRDGKKIVWPTPTHGRGLKPYRTAAECIDFTLPSLSIFATNEEAKVWAKKHGQHPPKRPLAENTLRRTARGLYKFVLNCASPFVVRIGHTGHGDAGKTRSVNDLLSTITTKNEHCLITPVLANYAYLLKNYTGVVGQSLEKELGTITTVDHHSLVTVSLNEQAAFVHRDFGNSSGASLSDPLPTVMTQGAGGKSGLVTAVLDDGAKNRSSFVLAFITKFFGSGGESSLFDPLHTITTKDRFGLVTVDFAERIRDICLRMLRAKELFLAQGFPASYKIDIPSPFNPFKKLSEKALIKAVGNSVSPPVAAALVLANVGAQEPMGPTLQEWEPGLVKSGEQLPLFDLAGIA